MRLQHKDLIPVLPRQKLIGQWRELCAIVRNIAINGSPNHILVNKVMEYPLYHLESYANLIVLEMKNRGYKVRCEKFYGWLASTNFYTHKVKYADLYKDWHNDRYLCQCYYNLQEKNDCGSISNTDWAKIEYKFLGKL